MRFTDLFIRRPVLATVVSLLILVLGLRSLFLLPVRQYPQMTNAVVTIATTYFGASADVMAGFITTPLENAIAQVNGIDYMSSSSTQGSSTITVNLRLNYDANKALSEIITQANSVRNQLPAEAQAPNISIAVGQTVDAMYIGFNSAVLPPNKITDYLIRVVQPQLQAIEGVQQVRLLGAKTFAIRAWLNPDKLAAYGLTAADVSRALGNNDFISAVGATRGQMVQVNLTASTNLQSLDEFRDLVVKQKGDGYVRLSDVANVTLGAEDYTGMSGFDGKPSVQIAIRVAPTANVLDVIKKVRAEFPTIRAQLPQGLDAHIAYDATAFINSSISEVIRTLIEAILIVTLVVFAFLGSPRAVLVPMLAIPLSLIGAATMMLAFGFSLNLLTLLALVLAIGLVVDDAIIVVENVSRHLEEGLRPLDAALQGARELGGPIIAMTLVLVAVYVPIGFMGGLTGSLFVEFAFTLVGAVTVSAIIALTLSPMLCGRILQPHGDISRSWEKRTVAFIDRQFENLRHGYARALRSALDEIAVIIVFAVIVLGSIYFLYSVSTRELAPKEDQGVFFTQVIPAPNATIDQIKLDQRAVYNAYADLPEMDHVFQFASPPFVATGLVLKPWDQRDRTANELEVPIAKRLNAIPSVLAMAFQLPALPGASGVGEQFVIQTTDDFARLSEVTNELIQEARQTGQFTFLNSDLKFDQPQATIVIDRDKVAGLGLTMRDVGSALTSMLGGGYINYFNLQGRAYRVIPQVEQRSRLNAEQLTNYHINTASGVAIPLSTFVHIENTVVPEQLNHFQQLNSATITAAPAPGVSEGTALKTLQDLAQKILPQGYRVDYASASRQYVQESSTFLTTFFFALLIIYLTLAALFESFRDPLIILVSVPMSICGALLFIAAGIGGASLNIYTEVGLVTLIGLISKHGILIVRFANDLREEGWQRRAAIEEAAAIRLRPILMTTAAMVLGVLPLIFASGAGAAARFNIGLVIASGIAIGTLFTLFVVPAMYLLIAPERQPAAPPAHLSPRLT